MYLVLFSLDPSNVICLQHCPYTHPVTNEVTSVKVGDSVTLPEVNGYTWTTADGNTNTKVKCLISKSSTGLPIGIMEHFTKKDLDECQINNPSTGKPHCDMKHGKCKNLDIWETGTRFECNCDSSYILFNNIDCIYGKYRILG